jgi:hypothetical protein
MRRRSHWVNSVVVISSEVVLIFLAASATRADAPVPVTGWLQYFNMTTSNVGNINNAGTNSPTVGSGTGGDVDNENVFGKFATLHINPGQQITLTGTLQFNRVANPTEAVPSGQFRFGLWDAVNPNASPATGWLGYMALAASGSGNGDFEVRNPDDPGFNTALALSNAGGGSIATTAGPAPASGSPLDGSGTGTGTGRYFGLGLSPVGGNAPLLVNTLYSFSVRVSRLASGTYSASATLSGGPYNWSIGATDFDGLFPPANGGTAAFTSHLSADYNRVAFTLPGGLRADSVNLFNVQAQVTNVPEPSTWALMLVGGCWAFALRRRYARCV